MPKLKNIPKKLIAFYKKNKWKNDSKKPRFIKKLKKFTIFKKFLTLKLKKSIDKSKKVCYNNWTE